MKWTLESYGYMSFALIKATINKTPELIDMQRIFMCKNKLSSVLGEWMKLSNCLKANPKKGDLNGIARLVTSGKKKY